MDLFCYATNDKYEEDGTFRKYALTRRTPYDLSYIQICKKYMTTYQRAQLRKLINFKFDKTISKEFGSKRLEAIEEQIQYRVNELLNL